MNVRFIDVEGTAMISDEVNGNWKNHDIKSLITFKDIVSFNYFKNMIEKLAEINMILKPNSIGKGYILYYKFYNNESFKEIEKDMSCFYYTEDIKNDVIEYLKKGYFFMYFTQQNFCYDPLSIAVDTLYSYMENEEHSFEIINDNIHWIFHGK